ncbi:MAG TPA: type III-A CRISPR-associated protein Csm2 [Clostridiaceae bacterium]|nr:type III-A CRISPR-associated protein Csm2 [Clostridiaceae bacterium]
MKGQISKIYSKTKTGIITCENGKKYEFDEKSLVSGVRFGDVFELMDMEFATQKQNNGKITAVNCRPIENECVSFFKEYVLDLNMRKEDYDTFCDYAMKYAERLKSAQVTTSMIRKIYARILKSDKVTDIKFLRPQFAYTSGRNEKNYILREFMDLLDFLAKQMELDNKQHLVNYKQFMEAIVAYRKYVGKDI